MSKAYFSPDTFDFLKELGDNNNRQWFLENKSRYEDFVKYPALCFINDFSLHLKEISNHFLADPRPIGGSLFRIYRDARFSKDKNPYKTNIGIQFRHSKGKDVHAPGFYLHIEPGNVIIAVGIWRPDSATLAKIRETIIEEPSRWKKAIKEELFCEVFKLSGDSLRRAPKGYNPKHLMIEDIKRKDFIGTAQLSQKAIMNSNFLDEFSMKCNKGSSLVKFLCNALGLQF